MILPQSGDLIVSSLGLCRFPSPLQPRGQLLVDPTNRVLVSAETADLELYLDAGQRPPSFGLAGPRAQLFFDPTTITCGIVTCGGLCPGVNDVIRSVVHTLTFGYGVPRVLGFRYGYAGLAANSGYPPIALTLEAVSNIHTIGGTTLGSSRGPQDVSEMVDTLQRHQVSILFTIGGDGTLRGAAALSREIAQRKLPISIIGIPKTIDNDLGWTDRSFGFATAVEEATTAIDAAHTEAHGAWNGIGLVKLMGRHSGFIAAHASLANSDVNFCLIPEVRFALEGKDGFLDLLMQRLERRHHAVIVVAEGAGQELLQDPAKQERDASGNLRLKDIGIFLRDEVTRFLQARHLDFSIKYIDPSYIIRSLPANAVDSEFCLILGQHAVHAGMAGYTDMVIGYWNRHFTQVPISLAVARRKQLDPEGPEWQSVLQATGQPASMMGTYEPHP
ncbi:MAG: ATP-dependent 6-phosphofructokinase [Deltaproteobacteria bacterium]|nr:ATP-dependent 6-phosphofructokinase [Deltaproteobacteria bacterium]